MHSQPTAGAAVGEGRVPHGDAGAAADPGQGDRGSAVLWIALYFAANLALTMHNKWILSRVHFDHPWLLSAIHIAVSGLGARLLMALLSIRPAKRASSQDWRRTACLLLFSTLYAVNIAVSNVSLSLVSLALHQIIRSTAPVFNIAIEMAMSRFQSRVGGAVLLSLLPIVAGVSLATVGEAGQMTFTRWGLVLTFAGVILSCIKSIATHRLLVGRVFPRMHPLELIWRVSIPSALQCVLLGHLFGNEVAGALSTLSAPSAREAGIRGALLANALLAFLLNCASFTATKQTCPLTMAVAGNCKQVLTILWSIYLFHYRASALNVGGIAMALTGGFMYR